MKYKSGDKWQLLLSMITILQFCTTSILWELCILLEISETYLTFNFTCWSLTSFVKRNGITFINFIVHVTFICVKQIEHLNMISLRKWDALLIRALQTFMDFMVDEHVNNFSFLASCSNLLQQQLYLF